MRCERCRFVWKVTSKHVDQLYEEVYEQGTYLQDHLRNDGRVKLPERPYLTELLPLAAGRSLLEVGPGAGYSLEYFRSQGYSVEGLDVSQKLADSIFERFGIKVRVGYVQDLPEDAIYDVVLATHVIEHVPDPRSFLKTIKSHLGPGGVIVLATPNCKCLTARVTRRRYWTYDVPDHVSFFESSTLSQLLEEEGFIVDLVTTYGTDVAHTISQRLRGGVASSNSCEGGGPVPKTTTSRWKAIAHRMIDAPFGWLGKAGLGYELVVRATSFEKPKGLHHRA